MLIHLRRIFSQDVFAPSHSLQKLPIQSLDQMHILQISTHNLIPQGFKGSHLHLAQLHHLLQRLDPRSFVILFR